MEKFLYILIVLFAFTSCITNPVDTNTKVIYQTSFETGKDVSQWSGGSWMKFSAPGCGQNCLVILGGSVEPDASFDIPTPMENAHYRFSFWAKISPADETASVQLIVLSPEGAVKEKLQVEVNRGEWIFYQSRESVYCPSESSLRMEISVPGGFVSLATVYFDQVSVVKVKQ